MGMLVYRSVAISRVPLNPHDKITLSKFHSDQLIIFGGELLNFGGGIRRKLVEGPDKKNHNRKLVETNEIIELKTYIFLN